MPAISPNGALAVETFSRVASFASAFIPANLGALEASSLAAVAAVGAVSGGAALALARRLRGLFWAAIGLAIYPRRAKHRVRRANRGGGPTGTPTPPNTLLYLPHDPVGDPCRLRAPRRFADGRTRARAGAACRLHPHRRLVAGQRSRTSRPRAVIRGLPHDRSAGSSSRRAKSDWRNAVGCNSLRPNLVTVVGPGTVVSTALLAGRARSCRSDRCRVATCRQARRYRVSGVLRMHGRRGARHPRTCLAQLAARRDAAPATAIGRRGLERAGAACPLDHGLRTTSRRAEQTIRRASYKNTDAKLARFNRRMSLPISIALIRDAAHREPAVGDPRRVSGSMRRGCSAPATTSRGSSAAFLSLAASMLDGCDGEIARLKYQESALGCWIETFGDYSYYIAIFAGLTDRRGAPDGMGELLLDRRRGACRDALRFALLIYLRSRITAGQPEKLHAIAHDRFKASGSTLVPTRLADFLRRHARGDAVRHHGAGAGRCAPGRRRSSPPSARTSTG